MWINRLVYKDVNKRKLFKRYEKQRYSLKYNIENKGIFNTFEQEGQIDYSKRHSSYYISKLPKYSGKTALRNRCIFTGRSGSPIRLFHLSRFCVKNLVNNGRIPGLYYKLIK